MRRASFLLLFLVLGSLLAAAPVRATTEYYALSFDGDDYILVHHSSSFETFNNGATWEVLINPSNLSSADRILFKKAGSFYIELERAFTGYIRANLWYNGTNYPISAGIAAEEAKTQHIVIVVETDATNGATVKLYINGELKSTKTNANVRGIDVSTNDMYVFSGFEGKGYIARMWNRPLSNSEVQQIYADPLNPPQDGLVLWYAPDSVDTAQNKWLDKSGNGNDGQIYGATAERVSIPSLSVYDAVNGTPISPLNVSLSMLYNNTTTGLVPSLPVLPYNVTVTLNVSATGHYPRLLTTWTGIDSLAVYLEPTNQTVEEPEVSNFNTTLSAPQEFSNFNPNFVDFESELRDIFTGRYGMLVAALMVIGLVVASLKFHQNPMTSVAVLGVAVVYIGSWAYVNWGWLYTLVVMLISAGIMRAFGRWREV